MEVFLFNRRLFSIVSLSFFTPMLETIILLLFVTLLSPHQRVFAKKELVMTDEEINQLEEEESTLTKFDGKYEGIE